MKISLCTVISADKFARIKPEKLIGSGQVPRLAPVYLARWMERNGYGQESYDFFDICSLNPSEEETRAYFRSQQPDIIGISAIFVFSYKYVKQTARIAREECPNALIVVGGHLSAAANVILKKTAVDFCVAGDGELSWVAILDYFKRNGRSWKYDELEKIAGLTYLDANGLFHFNGFAAGIPAFDIPLTDYDLLRNGLKNKPELLDIYFYTDFDPILAISHPSLTDTKRLKRGANMFTSKGCVARCTFCQRASKGYRTISLKKIEEHIIMLKEKFDVGFISILDENFGSDRKHAFAISELMKKKDILWVAGGVRVSTFSFDDLKILKENNCCGIFYGIESGSQAVIDVMEKKITIDQTVEALTNCIKLEMPVSRVKVLLGLPGESEKTVMETGHFLATIAHLLGSHPYHLGFTTTYVIPIPGTPLYEYGQQVGVIPTDLDGEETYIESLASLIDADKGEYVNLSGAPAKEAFFWDVLAQMEASRVYRELCQKSPPNLTRMGQILLDTRSPSPVSFWNRHREWVKNSPLIDALPRWLVYPLVKNILYADFRLRAFIRKLLGKGGYRFERFKNTKERLVLDPSRNDGKGGLDKSLRGIVRSRRPEPRDISEKSLQMLSDGQ
jgi:anaerobic magnesium-protoporphyrin IX monomethyl ester cyclase